MYTPLILSLVVLVIAVFINRRNFIKDVASFYLKSFVSAFFAFTVGLMIALMLGVKTSNLKMRTETVYIHSLKDGSQTQGSFTLGTGVINGRWMYTYYTKKKNSRGQYIFKANSIEASKANLSYSPDKPRIEYVYRCYEEDSRFSNFVLTPSDDILLRTIYVPEGSIENSFEIDAE